MKFLEIVWKEFVADTSFYVHLPKPHTPQLIRVLNKVDGIDLVRPDEWENKAGLIEGRRYAVNVLVGRAFLPVMHEVQARFNLAVIQYFNEVHDGRGLQFVNEYTGKYTPAMIRAWNKGVR